MKTAFDRPVSALQIGPDRLRRVSLATLATLAVALTGLLLAAAAPPVQAQPMAQPMAHHRMGPGRDGDLMMSGRLLDSVGASAEQKTRVQDILKTAHDDIRKQHGGDRDLQQQLLALLAAPQVDAAAAEGVRQKLQARHDLASKRRLQALLDAGAVLTPEQRQKVAERLKSRGDMMQRHHRERQATEPRS